MPSSRIAALFFGIWVFTWAIFWPVGTCDFVNFDDDDYVTAAPMISQGISWDGVRWVFSNVHAANWHPVTSLSHMLDCEWFGLNPRGHHFVNLFLHATNAALLFLLLLRLTKAPWPSAFAAAVFAWHPLHVESVAWVSERKDVLSTFFWLLTTMAYANYVKARADGDARRTRIYYAAVVGLFALGLMSKPMLVTLPFALLLLDFWPLRRFEKSDGTNLVELAGCGRKLVLEKVPLFVLTALFCVITFTVQNKAGAVQNFERFPFVERASNAGVSYVRYLGKTVWPTDLTVLYAHEGARSGLLVSGSLLMLAGITWAVLRYGRRLQFLPVGWLWFLGTLVPVIGLVQVGIQSIADRYMYVPMIGLLIVVAWGCPGCADRLKLSRTGLSMAGCLVLLACAFASRTQLQHWRDSESLWRRVVTVSPGNTTGHLMLADVHAQRGEFLKAAEGCHAALKVNPKLPQAYYNLGSYQQEQGFWDEAEKYYRQALALQPDLWSAHNNLAIVYQQLGRTEEALHHAHETVRLNATYLPGFCNLALHYIHREDLKNAEEILSRAIALDDSVVESRRLMGNVLAMSGRLEDAILHYQAALRLDSTLHDTHFNLGNCLAHVGRSEEAKDHYLQALRLKPDYEKARMQLDSLR